MHSPNTSLNVPFEVIWTNVTLATAESGYGLLENAAIAVSAKRIAWLGAMHDLSADDLAKAKTVIDAQGLLITPGFIDCHTHVVFAGDRANEFELRLNGASYEQIASLGGGIRSTVTATRHASEESLYQQSARRVRAMMASGTTVIEIKSGYGLDRDSELKMLRVAERLEAEVGITVKRTYLGAHSVPPEYQGRGDDYIDFVCKVMIPEISASGIATAVDVFGEKIAFSRMQTEKVFAAAKA